MVSKINIENALSLDLPIIDVRSPGEFNKGHIPGAVNIPLFLDNERANVGTTYKQKSKNEAIKLGYNYVIPKLESFIFESFQVAPKGEVIVHCWRGGMRSSAFANYLAENGFANVKVIIGGYKTFRNFILKKLDEPFDLKVLGGYTGSGKTHILKELKNLGHQVIDLEGLANHKGSAFGGIDQKEQPTDEQFANNLFNEINLLDSSKPIWVEDESIKIGKIKIPQQFFDQMRKAKLYFINIPKKKRAEHLVVEYSYCKNKDLAESISRIKKRLGGLAVKQSIEFLDDNNYFKVAMLSLNYYDKSYLKGMNKRDTKNRIEIPLETTDHYKNALIIEEQI